MPAMDLAAVGSLGGAFIGSVADSSSNNTNFSLGMWNNGLGAALGIGFMPNEKRHYGLMVRGRYIVSQTSLDLATHFAAIGAEAFLRLTPSLSLVPTLRGDWLYFVRVTNSGAPDIQHWGYGAGLGLDYTFVRFDQLSFFARTEVSGSIIPHAVLEPRSGLLSGVLMIGARFSPD